MPQFSTEILILFICLLLVTSGFFSGSETGMMAINRYRLRHHARGGNRTAKLVSKMLSRPDRLLGVILIGNTFANILASALATLLAVRLFGEVGIAVATVVLTIIVLVFAEVLPKTIAALFPYRVAFGAAWPLRFLQLLLYPFVWLANTIVNGFLRIFGVKLNSYGAESLSGEELRTVVYEAGGKIPIAHQEMLLRIFDLETITVEDIMTPRSEIVGIDLDDDWDIIHTHLTTSQHTRLLLYHGNIDNVLGIVHLRDVLHQVVQGELDVDRLRETATPAYFIPERTPLNIQLLKFRQEKQRIALAVDEYGDLQGLVTLEDLLEEIVGEFTTDIADSYQDVYEQKDGSFLVDGSVNLRELNRSMDWSFSVDGPKTLNGTIVEYLESIPQVGTCMKIDGYPIEVVKVKDNRVKTARVFPNLLPDPVTDEVLDTGSDS